MDNLTPDSQRPENLESPKNEKPDSMESQTEATPLPENRETEEEIKEIADGRDIEIEEAWAEALHMEYDPDEARRRAEKISTPPPGMPFPPVSPIVPPRVPPRPAPYNPAQQTNPAPQPHAAQQSNGAQQFNAAQQPYVDPQVQNPVNPANYQGHPEPMPPTFLVWSVLATVLCCLIPGIVAIVYSSMVSSKYYAKDYEGARRCSRMAEIWIIVSIVLGVITAAVYVPISLLIQSL